MQEKEIKVRTSRLFKEGRVVKSDKSEEEVVDVVRLDPEAPYCTISTDRKATVNMGNYNSASVSVFMSVPSLLNDDDIENAYKFVKDFCERKIGEEISALRGEE